MALVLGVIEADKIYIDNKVLTVLRIHGLDKIEVDVGGRTFILTDQESEEVLPGVFVYCGVPKKISEGREMLARLAFDAPRDIKIDRGFVHGKRQR